MKKWVPAPGSSDQTACGAVLGVFLDIGEGVDWAYTILPDGRRVVTGYEIIPILPPQSKEFPENS
jgi:hypothetical protein